MHTEILIKASCLLYTHLLIVFDTNETLAELDLMYFQVTRNGTEILFSIYVREVIIFFT
jgi:hypothetical protein